MANELWQLEENTDRWQLEENTDRWTIEGSDLWAAYLADKRNRLVQE